MRGRLWLWLGVALGIAIGIGKVPYLAGAASSLAATSVSVVRTGGLSIIHATAKTGAPHRVIEGLAAFIGILVPGVAALLLLLAARVTLAIRSLVAVLIAVLGFASFAYYSTGHAVGVVALALGIAAVLVVLTGPLVIAPLAAIAALIATAYLPKLLQSRGAILARPVNELHQALFSTPGSPLWLAVIALLIAAVPFGLAARQLFR